MSTVEPIMGLVVSTIGVDSGLLWEQNLNLDLLTIAAHNHTPGSGNPIPPSGLTINASLPFNNQQATGLQAVQFTPQSSISATLPAVGALYVSGVDLYFNDGTGTNTPIQITSGGLVNATSSGISSGTATASFISSVLVVNAASNKPANIQAGSILLGNNVTSSKFLTLAPPSAMAANYGLTLPPLPASQKIMTLDASGNITAPYVVDGSTITVSAGTIAVPTGGITATQVANGTLTTTQLNASAGIVGTQLANTTITATQIANSTITPIQMSSFEVITGSSGSFSTNSTVGTTVTNLSNITFAGRSSTTAVFFSFVGGSIGVTDAIAGTLATFIIQRGLVTVATFTMFNDTSAIISVPCGALNFILPHSGTGGNFSLIASVNSASSSVQVTNVVMQIFQV